MRLAVIADIHGNEPALDAVLRSIAKLRVDRLVVAGDVVNGGPDSRACWERVRALGCPVLRGNHERYVFDLGTERARPEWSTLQFAPVQYAAAQVGDAYRKEMAACPTHLRLAECPDLLIVHASARNDQDVIYPGTKEEDLASMFAGTAERWIVRGHNHYSGVHLWGARRIVTAGAVGLPLDGNTRAQFVIMERKGGDWTVEHHAVLYDVAETLRRFRQSGYLEKAGPMAHLFYREVETASFHIVPFLKFQTAYLHQHAGATLTQAWEAYSKRGY